MGGVINMAQKYRCICEVCGKEEILTLEEAYLKGWDYPPKMGTFGILSPRTCPDCPIEQTVWWKLMKGDTILSDKDIEIINRVQNEPSSILIKETENEKDS